MGDLIHLSERRADRSRPSGELARFFFAPDDPLSYLAAERVERALGPIAWVPVLGPLAYRSDTLSAEQRLERAHERMAVAEVEAATLGLPLVDPHRVAMDGRRAARAALFAAEAGAAASFGLALMRLAFCGGFDIGSSPVLEEAAAVAGLDPVEVDRAARNRRLDLALDATSRGLTTRGVQSPPAISIGNHWFDGPTAVIAALAFSAAHGLTDTPVLPAS